MAVNILKTGSKEALNQKLMKREKKIIRIVKEEIRQSVYAEDMILYEDNPKDSTKKREFINKFSK